MKIGIAIPNFGKFASKENITRIALAAQEHEFDSLWLSDHIVMPNSHKGFGNNFYEPVATLAYLSSITQTITLGTSIIVLPYRNPVALAKSIATIDQLSDGRLIMGVGAGWLKEEFHALGADYKNRKSRTVEYINILKALWYSNKPEFKGMYYNFSDISFVPKPYNGRKIQIWMGGNSNESIDMAIEYCNGWHGVGLTPGRLKLVSGHIEKKLVSNGTSCDKFTISVRKNLQITDDPGLNTNADETLRGSRDKIIEGLTEYKLSGASHIIIYILSSLVGSILDTIKTVSTDIRPYIV